MPTSIRFPSLGKGHEIAYVLHSSPFEYGWRLEPLHCIAPWAGVFQTYGDGMVQHSPDICCSVDFMSDYLASLTTFLLDPRNEDALDIASGHWHSLGLRNDRAKIVKARQIQFKEGKMRYVMVREMSISAADSKRHDRRWHQIVEWMDGSVGAVFSLLHMDSGGVYGLERYLMLARILEVFYEETGSTYGLPEHYFDRFKSQHIREAFEAFECLVAAHQNRKRVGPILECYGRNVARAANAQTA